MEILTTSSILGIILFFMGVIILNFCTSMERKNLGGMKSRRTLKLYGRRKKDSEAAIHYDNKGSWMTFAGATLSFTGLIQMLRSINWTDF